MDARRLLRVCYRRPCAALRRREAAHRAGSCTVPAAKSRASSLASSSQWVCSSLTSKRNSKGDTNMTPKQITRNGLGATMIALALGTLSNGCAGTGDDGSGLHSLIGAEGGELVGAPGTPFEGVRVQIPAGAVSTPTDVSVSVAAQTVALPKTAVRCGQLFALEPAGLDLAKPAIVTLPYDPKIVADNFRFEDQVRVWVSKDAGWTQRLQTDNGPHTVTVEVTALSIVSAGVVPPAEQDEVHFELHPNPKFLKCLAQNPDDEDAQ